MNLMHTKIRIYFLWVFFLKNNICMSVEKNKNTCNEHPNKKKSSQMINPQALQLTNTILKYEVLDDISMS